MIPTRLRSWLASPAATWWAAGAAILLAAPSLFSGLQGDDFIFLAEVQAGASASDLFDPFHFSTEGQEHVSALKARGELPWWVDNGARLRFWRPITSVSHYLDFSLWPEAAWFMHAQNLAWYVLLIFLAATLYRRLSGQAWVAGLATWLYAVDDCHAQPVGWITARNTIMGAAVGLAAVLVHDLWRREGWKVGSFLAPMLFAAALLCSEGALAFGGYLVAHALLIDRDTTWRRLLCLLPYAVLVVAWRIYYVTHDYGVAGLSFYRDPSSDPFAFVLAAVQNGVILCTTQFTLPVAMPTMAFKETATLLALAVLALLALGLGPTLRHHPRARFWALGMVLSTIPFGAAQPADRLLMPVGLGAFAVLARFVADLDEMRIGSWPRRFLGWIMLGLHGLLAVLLFVPQLYLAGFVQKKVDALDAAIPSGPGAEDREIVVVQMPEAITLLFLHPQRQVRGKQYPSTVLPLYAGQSSLEVERIDDNTLEIRPRNGFLAHAFESMFRADELRFVPGERHEVGPMVIEIRSTTAAGKPREVRFHFEDGIEAPHRDWMSWRNGRLAPWSPPAIGEVTRLTGVSPF